jgi:putative ABC transport system substrate-binding protein
VRRRGLIAVLAGAAAWPLLGHAQQPERVRRVGWLIGYFENDPFARRIVTAFVQALARSGWVEGKNIWIDYRFAAGDPTLAKTYAAELVGLEPDVILATPGLGVFPLRRETCTIPIVFVLMPDPVELGVVQSLARPGGNITGFASYDASMIGKWVQLLKQVAPGVTRIAVIFNPDTAYAPSLNHEIEAARSFGVTVTFAPVQDDAAIDAAIAAQAREPGGGLINLSDSFNVRHRDVIIAAATRYSLPLIGWEVPTAGVLMSYWFDAVELHPQAASYIDRIQRAPSQPTSRFNIRQNTR